MPDAPISPTARTFIMQVDKLLDRYNVVHGHYPVYLVLSRGSVSILFSDVNNITREQAKRIMQKLERDNKPFWYRGIPVKVSPAARNMVVMTDKWPWTSAEWAAHYLNPNAAIQGSQGTASVEATQCTTPNST